MYINSSSISRVNWEGMRWIHLELSDPFDPWNPSERWHVVWLSVLDNSFPYEYGSYRYLLLSRVCTWKFETVCLPKMLLYDSVVKYFVFGKCTKISNIFLDNRTNTFFRYKWKLSEKKFIKIGIFDEFWHMTIIKIIRQAAVDYIWRCIVYISRKTCSILSYLNADIWNFYLKFTLQMREKDSSHQTRSY